MTLGQSQLDLGTTFAVYLPVSQGATEAGAGDPAEKIDNRPDGR